MISMLPPQRDESFRNEASAAGWQQFQCIHNLTTPRADALHPQGGKPSPVEDNAADDCRQRSVGYKILVLPVSGDVAVVDSWQAARVWMRGLKSEAERGLYTEAGRQHY